jgi:chemotaxis protein MotB
MMESEAGTFFGSGQSAPTKNGDDLLTTLAREMANLPNQISIEGHTDATPFARDGDYGNWELSADRANAARRLMERAGLKPHQVSQVRGYADQRLRTPGDPGNPSNRRISVIVQYLGTGKASPGR